jgi:signal transduction histidine kinase
VHWCKGDEICILANTINNSFVKINQQTSNLKQFITDVSHEFKTPLMVINSKIDLYKKLEEKWKASPKELDKLLSTIKQRTKKLNNILETLFVFSRKIEGIDKIKCKNINLSNYISTYIDDYVANITQDIEIQYNITKSVTKCIDIELFNIIIDNLLSNAIKFSWEKKVIKIWLTDDQFYVQDYGPGIDKDNLEKIWEKFYRQDTNIEGFWVWLFLVKRVTEVFNWKIAVLSKKWKGAKFIIQF